MIKLNKYESRILAFLQIKHYTVFTNSEITKYCQMNVRTTKKYLDKLYKQNKINKKSVRGGKGILFSYRDTQT